MLEVQAVIFPLNDPRKTSIASNKSLKAIFHNWAPHLNNTEPGSKRFTFNKAISILRLPLSLQTL
jgi:hypothetical protein